MDKLILTPLKKNNFLVVQDIVMQGIKIPAGFVTNGANIPRLFWCIIPPFKPKYLRAVVLHDYLCDKEQYKLADILFKKELLSVENSLKTKIMVMAVKLYHKIKYKVK